MRENKRIVDRARRSRSAFTLVELLVAISIIGILAGLALGGMYQANLGAKRTNSRTTVTKVAAQIQEIWESYRNRKLPIDPKLVLQPSSSIQGSPYYIQWSAATGNTAFNSAFTPGWLPYFSQIRTNAGAAGIPLATNPNNNLQVAALRLAATRELMRLELPCRFSDFTSSTSGSPANAQPVQTLLIPQPMSNGNTNGSTPLANPGGLSEQYRQFFRAHANTFNNQYESAECLYMIIKFASQNELGQKNITDDPRLVGDTDGDGMPEIQDAFSSTTFTPGSPPYTQHNMPIAFIRWPTGYLSDLQPGPTLAQYGNPNPTPSWTYTYEYAAARHDIYDPLRIDPRAFTITPLVFSAGADGTYDVWEHSALPNLYAYNDPYYTDNTPGTKSLPIFPITPNPQNPSPNPPLQAPLPGAVMGAITTWPNGSGSGGYADNITNHVLNARPE